MEPASIVVVDSPVRFVAQPVVVEATGDRPRVARDIVGRAVLAEWQGVYYPATILAVIDAARVRVHYDGWGAEWDEDVHIDRVVEARHLDGRSLEGAVARPYDFRGARIGDPLQVSWHGSWWKAHVERVVAADQLLIHYDGYGHEWDEVVGPDRVRQP
jgi:hypothetical protein